jgi:FtsP/CotA-like multicopper oxidase with cupredoxin domain
LPLQRVRFLVSPVLPRYGEGVLGGIIINGPATANYDIDLGTMTVQDWYHFTASQRVPGPPPPADNGLINGTMVNSTGGGHYLSTVLEKGKKYRLRLINTSIDNYFKVHLDNHKIKVIAADFVPIVPYETDWLFIAIGNRSPLFFLQWHVSACSGH